jgi:hypothetical protein
LRLERVPLVCPCHRLAHYLTSRQVADSYRPRYCIAEEASEKAAEPPTDSASKTDKPSAAEPAKAEPKKEEAAKKETPKEKAAEKKPAPSKEAKSTEEGKEAAQTKGSRGETRVRPAPVSSGASNSR